LLWDLALRLEMLCSCLESPEKAATLRKPELSLLDRMKNQGGEITDKVMLNLLEHQVTRIEVSLLALLDSILLTRSYSLVQTPYSCDI
jgi:hypothetical protein